MQFVCISLVICDRSMHCINTSIHYYIHLSARGNNRCNKDEETLLSSTNVVSRNHCMKKQYYSIMIIFCKGMNINPLQRFHHTI